MRLYKRVAALIIFFAFAVVITGCSDAKQTDGFFAMGSYIEQTVYNADKALLESVKSDIIKADLNISAKIGNSYISLLNKEKTAVFDTQTYNILYRIVEFCGETDGFFDISLLLLTDLWDFENQNPSVPERQAINAVLEKTGYENILLGEDNTVKLLEEISVDLGAVGKGYACDLAVEAYKKAGASGIIAVGGSIGIHGVKPDGEFFRVGIRNPFSSNTNDIFAGIEAEGGFVSTSGSYEKYFIENSVRYHHILNPKTGYPVENELISVSVFCDNGMLSDMLSTACFVLGIEDSLPLLDKYGAEAIFVKNNKKVAITEGLKEKATVYSDFEVDYI